jgi:3-hydroxyisobutyrate dehydrogenase
MNIGWIGLGNMGIPMVKNLLKAGYPVQVFNRTESKASEVVEQGAINAEAISKLVENSDVIITMVSDDQAVKELYLGKEGLLHTKLTGKTLIDMSTVSANTSKEVYKGLKKLGAQFLDAPVSGSVQPAREGNLIVLVGGDEEVYQEVKAVFEPLSKMSLYLGDSGSGSNAKLAINLLLGITVQGIAESVLFAKSQGIRTEDMLEIINESAVGTAISKLKTSSILDNEFPAAFALKHMAKDLRLAKETSKLNPLGESTNNTFQEALENLGDNDVMAVLQYLNER